MTKDDALKLALEHGSFPQGSGVIHAIKEALAQTVSSHGNAEDLYIEMSKHLNCPHCGGSGHIDDVAQPKPYTTEAMQVRQAVAKALAQPEQEPVAEIVSNINGFLSTQWSEKWSPNPGDKLYTTPPQRKPLTDEEIINKCLDSGFERNSLGWSFTYGKLDYHLLKLARAIETAHGIKEST